MSRDLQVITNQLRIEKLISPELSERLAVQLQKADPGFRDDPDIRSFLSKDQQAEVASGEQILCSKMGIQVFCNLLFRGLPLDKVYDLIAAGSLRIVDAGKVVYSRGQEDRLGRLE